MRKPTKREQYEAQTVQMAREAFAQHAIREQDDMRIWIQRKEPSGDWTWTYSAEIILLKHGALLVHGDISHVLFSQTDAQNIRDALYWLHEDFGSGYVNQKAVIGMRLPGRSRQFDHIRLTYAHAAILRSLELLKAAA